MLGESSRDGCGAGDGDAVRVLVPQVTLAPWGPMPRSTCSTWSARTPRSTSSEDAQRAYVALEDLRRLLRARDGTSWIEVRLDDLAPAFGEQGALRAALGSDWLVVDLIEQNQEILKAFKTEKLFLFLAIGLIVVVASLNIVSTLVLMVNDKVQEIGTLTAMGARPVGIAAVFMLQGIVIGLVGTSLGLALGIGVGLLARPVPT